VSPTDQYTEWDAAYVLGALSPSERREYENHLAGCAGCQGAVAELAGLPGLLAQVPPGEALALDAQPPSTEHEPEPPASLMPAHLPRTRGRSSWSAPLAAAAAALLIGGVGGYAASLGGSAGEDPSASPTPTSGISLPARVAFSPVKPTTMTAILDLAPVAGGTEVRVECQYATSAGPGSGATGGTGATSGAAGATTGAAGATTGAAGATTGAAATKGGHDYGAVDYAIWVVARDGQESKLKMWTARPGRLMRPSAVTPLPADEIRSVEIRYVEGGATVMRADVS
jgi:Putative zinc-finger